MKAIQKAAISTALALLILLQMSLLKAQNSYCRPAGKYLPENDCNECVLDSKYNIVVQTMLDINEVNRMEEELNKLVEQSDAYYKSYGNLKQKGFDALDLDLKKLYAEMEKNPQKADDLISWLEGILEQAGCGKGSFDGRTEGVADGGLQSVRDNASAAITNLKFPNYSGPAELTFDCCQPHWQPNDQFIQNCQQLHQQFLKFKQMFDNLKLLHQVNMQGVQMSAMQFMKYDQNAREKMERLRNNSFSNVVGNALVQSGALSQAQLNTINGILQKYAESNDKLGAKAEIERLVGKDAADLYGAMFEDFTPADLLGKFGEVVKNNPAKLKTLNKLSKYMPGIPQWFGTFMNLVGIAEMTVNIGFDTFLKLGGDAPVIKAENDLWCVTAWYYYCAASSVLKNAAALYQLKKAILHVQSYFPQVVVPMPGPAPQYAWQADQEIVSAFSSATTKGSLEQNHYTVQLPDQKTMEFVFGNYNCGKWIETRKAEITPGPRQPKDNSGLLVDPGPVYNNSKDSLPTFSWAPPIPSPAETKPKYRLHITEVLPLNDSLNAEQKHVEFNAGMGAGGYWYWPANAGYTWINPRPYSALDSLLKAEVIDGLNAGLINPNGDTKITLKPGWHLDFSAGCAVNHRFEVNFSAGGGTYNAKAELPVKVVRIVPPVSPSAPPATQQSNETIAAKMLVGSFDFKLGGRIYFGKQVRGFTSFGAAVGLNHIDNVTYSVADINFTDKLAQTTIFGGGYTDLGVSVPVLKWLNFEILAGSNLLVLQKHFIAVPNVNAGLRFRL